MESTEACGARSLITKEHGNRLPHHPSRTVLDRLLIPLVHPATLPVPVTRLDNSPPFPEGAAVTVRFTNNNKLTVHPSHRRTKTTRSQLSRSVFLSAFSRGLAWVEGA